MIVGRQWLAHYFLIIMLSLLAEVVIDLETVTSSRLMCPSMARKATASLDHRKVTGRA